MYHICLYFRSINATCILEKTACKASKTDIEIECVRQRGSINSFQWTTAVKAWCILLLQHSLSDCNAQNKETFLEGETGSLAASLDMAISKEPNWLLDICGLDEQGYPVFKQLVNRTNPERKRPGPVIITIKNKLLPPQNIKIYHNNQIVDQESGINRLLTLLGQKTNDVLTPDDVSPTRLFPLTQITVANTHSNKIISLDHYRNDNISFVDTGSPQSNTVFNDIEISSVVEIIKKKIHQEVVKELVSNETFLVKKQPSILQNLLTNPFISKHLFINPKTSFWADAEFAIPSIIPSRYDPLFDKLCTRLGRSIKLATIFVTVGAATIIEFLRNNRLLPVELNYHYSYSCDLFNEIKTSKAYRDIDGFIVSSMPAIEAINEIKNTGYFPCMFMPGITHRAVTKGDYCDLTKKHLISSEFLYVMNDFSTTQFFFEELCCHFNFNKKYIKKTHATLDDMPLALESNYPTFGILGYGHALVNELFNDCKLHNILNDNVANTTMLFLRKDLYNDELFRLNIRREIFNAWLSLLEEKQIREHTVTQLLNNKERIRGILRSAGVHTMKQASVLWANGI